MRFALAGLFAAVTTVLGLLVLLGGESGGNIVCQVTDAEFSEDGKSIVVSHVEGRRKFASLQQGRVTEAALVANVYEVAGGSHRDNLLDSPLADSSRIGWLLLPGGNQIVTDRNRLFIRVNTFGRIWYAAGTRQTLVELNFEVLDFVPSAACNTVFVSDTSGVKAITLDTLQQRWATKSPGSLGSACHAIAYSEKSDIIALGVESGIIFLDSLHGALMRQIPAANLLDLEFDLTEGHLFIAEKHTVSKYMVSENSCENLFEIDEEIRQFSISKRADFAAVITDLGVHIVNTHGGDILFVASENRFSSACFSPDSTKVVLGDTMGVVSLLDLASGEIEWSRLCEPKVRQPPRYVGLVLLLIATSLVFLQFRG